MPRGRGEADTKKYKTSFCLFIFPGHPGAELGPPRPGPAQAEPEHHQDALRDHTHVPRVPHGKGERGNIGDACGPGSKLESVAKYIFLCSDLTAKLTDNYSKCTHVIIQNQLDESTKRAIARIFAKSFARCLFLAFPNHLLIFDGFFSFSVTTPAFVTWVFS